MRYYEFNLTAREIEILRKAVNAFSYLPHVCKNCEVYSYEELENLMEYLQDCARITIGKEVD